jgi:hypothetical protein
MFLPTALDEIKSQAASLDAAEALIRKNAETINRQAKRIAELEAITGVEITDHNLSLIRSILHGEPHTREQRIRAFNLSGKVFRRMQKQRATLKKLGQAKRERGKALVNEVAARIAYENNMQLCECEEYAKCQARRQLRQDGKP